MQRAGSEFLAGARLPHNQYRRVGGANPANAMFQFFHGRAVANHVVDGVAALHIPAKGAVAPVEAPLF